MTRTNGSDSGVVRSFISATLFSARQRGAILLFVALAVLSLASNLLQIWSSGTVGIWITVAAIIITLGLIGLFVSPVVRKTVRGDWLFSALRRTALIDVEHREDREHRLPPSALFHAHETRPILISGILDQLFQQNRDQLVGFVRRGGSLRVLLLHPRKVAESLDRGWTTHREDWQRYWLTNCNEAQVALDGLIEAGLDKQTGCQVRFLTDIPPFFGVLVGDPHASRWRRPRPFIRVQPLAISRFVGRGSVMTFEQIPGSERTPFAYYSADLDAQWETALDDVDLLKERRAALTSS